MGGGEGVLTGSSPLTRGKQCALSVNQFSERLIPAHAGKTRRGTPTTRSRPAHPRSRGENNAARYTCADRRGSSPLTRGKPGLAFVRNPRPRLTPDRAGKTQICDVVVGRARGSSPLTRGKRRRHPAGPTRRRLIPAHAGKTLRVIPDLKATKAHPRSRGENRS